MSENAVGDPLERQHLVRRAERDGGLGHAEDHGTRFVLSNGERAGAVHGEQALGAVTAHAGQQHAGGAGAGLLGGAVEHDVD